MTKLSINSEVTVDGITKTVTEWAAARGLSPKTIVGRVNNNGWDVTKAVTTPAMGAKARGRNGRKSSPWDKHHTVIVK